MIVSNKKLKSLIRESMFHGPLQMSLVVMLSNNYIKNTSAPLPYRFFINYLLGTMGISEIDNSYFSNEQQNALKIAAIECLKDSSLDDINNPNKSTIKSSMDAATWIILSDNNETISSMFNADDKPGWTISGKGLIWEIENSLRKVNIEYHKNTNKLLIKDKYDFNIAEDVGYDTDKIIKDIANFNISANSIHRWLESYARENREYSNQFNIKLEFTNVTIDNFK